MALNWEWSDKIGEVEQKDGTKLTRNPSWKERKTENSAPTEKRHGLTYKQERYIKPNRSSKSTQKTISKEFDMEIKRRDVWFAELSQGGSIQTGERPVLIIQNDIGNKHSPNVIVLPVTSKIKKINMPTHVLYRSQNKRWCMILAEQICTISKEQLQFKIEELDESIMEEVTNAIIASLGL